MQYFKSFCTHSHIMVKVSGLFKVMTAFPLWPALSAMILAKQMVPNQLNNPFLAPMSVSVASVRSEAWQNSVGSWCLSHVPAIPSTSLVSLFHLQDLIRATIELCWFLEETDLDYFILLKIQRPYLKSKLPALVTLFKVWMGKKKLFSSSSS